jgi:uncharacterized protein (DUF2342 family)
MVTQLWLLLLLLSPAETAVTPMHVLLVCTAICWATLPSTALNHKQTHQASKSPAQQAVPLLLLLHAGRRTAPSCRSLFQQLSNALCKSSSLLPLFTL